MDVKITVSGQQGCGKTALAEKLADWLLAQGFNVTLQDEGRIWTYPFLGEDQQTASIVTEQTAPSEVDWGPDVGTEIGFGAPR